jgi:type III restriction enzyme
MEFQFKIQPFQTEAAESVVKVFAGQPNYGTSKYRRDVGKRKAQVTYEERDAEFETGYRNADIELTKEQLLKNIHEVQTVNNIKHSTELVAGLGAVSLDVEMETGERVIIVMGAINVLKSRVSGTFTEKFLCIAYSN